VTLSAVPLPGSDFGTRITLWQMRAMVYREFMNPMVRLTATEIAAGTDGAEQAHAIRDYLEHRTEFVRDPDGVEMLHGPVWQLQQIRQNGVVRVDCDDVAMLAAALGKAVGLRARFVVVGFDNPRAPYRHVWAELSPRNLPAWVDMDVTRPAQGLPFNRIARVLNVDV
jgi:transglutaminase-like putative cysteine protease